jgi:biopolymer transport protein ExbB
MKLPLILATALCVGALTAPAQDFEQAARSAQADLQRALDELAALQKQIAEQKVPLAQKLNALEDAVLQKRRENDTLQRTRDNQLVELNVLRTEVKNRRDEVDYLSTLLHEYARQFETRIHIAEAARFKAALEDAKAAADNKDLGVAEKLERQAALVRTALQRLENLAGGETFAGSALSPSGRMEKGRFTLLGPVAMFASEESPAAGLAELQLGSPEPSVIEISPQAPPLIRAITANGRGDLPLDATLGNAVKIAETRDSLLEHLRKGGPVMVPIVGVALAGLFIAVFKWVQIARVRVATPADLQTVLNHLAAGNRGLALDHARLVGGPTGALLEQGIRHVGEKKEYVEEVLYETMLNAKPRLERWIPFLALTAAAAPLLGLLGTVTGMINTFNMISVFGTGDPKTLSGGISEALITTECGLYVAIPALLSQAILSRKVKSILGSMEQLTVGFINGLPENKTVRETENSGVLAR